MAKLVVMVNALIANEHDDTVQHNATNRLHHVFIVIQLYDYSWVFTKWHKYIYNSTTLSQNIPRFSVFLLQ